MSLSFSIPHKITACIPVLMHATYLAHLILLDYMDPIIPGEQYKPESSSYAILQNRLPTAIICNTVTSYLRGSDGDLLREGVVLGVDLGVEPADKSPGGRDSCLLRRVSFSSGTANNKQLTSELSVCVVPVSTCGRWQSVINLETTNPAEGRRIRN